MTPVQDLERKFQERFDFISHAVTGNRKLLEIGCAEGLFGKFIKEKISSGVEITGIEVSRDAHEACNYLDRVHHGTMESFIAQNKFDMIMVFHVLEHLADLEGIIGFCKNNMVENGQLVLEVPHGSGNRLVPYDRHVEHCHFFSTTSLCALLEGHGFIMEKVATGCYESATYNDALRVLCRLDRWPENKLQRFKERFEILFGHKCIVFGTGKDFFNWIEPYLPPNVVVAVMDNNTALHGHKVAGCFIDKPEHVLSQMKDEKILVTTYRYTQEIVAQLLKLGVFPERIVTMDTFFQL